MKYGIAAVTAIAAAAVGYWYFTREEETVAPAEEPVTATEEPSI